MATNDMAILAGEGPAGLCYIGDPTDALDTALAGLTYNGALTSSPLSNLHDVGWCTDNGLIANRNYATSGVNAYGSRGVPVRTFVTTDIRTFQIGFLETNVITVAVYDGRKLADVTATSGVISLETGDPVATASYSIVFDIVDPERGHGRIIVPRADVTAVAQRDFKGATAVVRDVTFTAKPVTVTTGSGETATSRVIATRELWYLGTSA